MSKNIYIPSTTEGKTWKLDVGKDRNGFVVGEAYEGTELCTGVAVLFRYVIGDRKWTAATSAKRLTEKAKVRALKAIEDKLWFSGCIKEKVL